jgi:transposase
MGRPLGKSDKLEERRFKAIEMVEKHGLTQAEVARRLKIDSRTIRKWMAWHRGRGVRKLESRPTPGRPSRLDKKQHTKLETILMGGAQKAGFPTDLWTCPRIAHVIRHQFGIRYHVDHVIRLMRSLGWSPQKPESRAIERDEKAIRRWVKRTWPRIKKKPTTSARRSPS